MKNNNKATIEVTDRTYTYVKIKDLENGDWFFESEELLQTPYIVCDDDHILIDSVKILNIKDGTHRYIDEEDEVLLCSAVVKCSVV